MAALAGSITGRATRVAAPTRRANRLAAPAAPRPLLSRRRVSVVVRASMDEDKRRRLEVIDALYTEPSMDKISSLLADDFSMGEEGFARKFGKQDYLGLMQAVLAAVPDFRWGHACSGDVDRDGWLIVSVAATGHHTGAELRLPNLEPLPPSGKHFCLSDEIQKVRVKGAQVAEIQVLPNRGAGPRALYAALGGKLPAAATTGGAPPMP